jgi:hypothetical protein
MASMSWLSALIFLGIPAVGILVAAAFGVATLARWNRGLAPEPHYIASRMQIEPKDEAEAEWLAELNVLQLPYRHTIC